MKRLIIFLVFFAVVTPAFAEGPISRRDGFLLIWNSVKRPATETRETPFEDVVEGEAGFMEITYAKRRRLIDDDDPRFYPDEPLKRFDALFWLFRTRNLEVVKSSTEGLGDIIESGDVPVLAAQYDLSLTPNDVLSQEQLIALISDLDSKLAAEDHEVSLYSEKFQGKGTAFGESFDMNQLTAAHRTYPGNTIVRVTNIENGKSVVVRINDRGPYVVGRDMDLSLASFLKIAERAKGKIRARFERLGDISLVDTCKDDRYRRRIGRGLVLKPGIPKTFRLGDSLNLSADTFFVVRSIIHPDGTVQSIEQWIGSDETFPYAPEAVGDYTFKIGNAKGVTRSLSMEVMNCGQ